jgi:hypothetical protein
VPNPDPAVFEAAFVIDDSDDPSRSGTPKPAPPEKDASSEGNKEGEVTEDRKSAEKTGSTNDEAAEKADSPGQDAPAKEKKQQPAADPPAPAATPELPPEIKQRLRKLDKLETTYPGR